MNLLEILKQFKNIEPDANAKESSKRAIMALPQNPLQARGSFGGVWGIFEAGIAVVLVGFFIIVISGSFPGTSYLAPVQYSVIDPQGLHAEAQAIDMQIQLADLNYAEVTSTPPAASSPAPKKAATSKSLSAPSSAGSTENASSAATSTSSSTMSLDSALQQLSQ